LVFSYLEQYRKAQPPEGAAPFHPVCSIDHFDASVVSRFSSSATVPLHYLLEHLGPCPAITVDGGVEVIHAG
jgi:hypothetical protein